jgi:Glycosyl hydrolase 2 galactose-binding domain-like
MTPPLARRGVAVPDPHRIRLRGPWDVRPHAAGARPGRMTVPGTLRAGGWPGYVGPVSFYRRFGRPSNLGTGDRVRLAFAGVTGRAEVLLNGERVGEVAGAGVVDVTDRLRERNELEVVVAAADEGCGIVGDVVIEIVCR